jgi:predicted permease
MRHPLNVLLRFRRTEAERHALVGDLEEAYRSEIRPARSRIAAQAWYAREVLTAFGCAIQDGLGMPRLRTGLTGDARYALRRWRRHPGFAVTCIITLALGIAAATATFSVVDGVLLRPLPWKDPDRLVYVHGVYPNWRSNPATAPTWNRGLLSHPAWDALRTTKAFEEVAVWRSAGRLDTTFGEHRDEIVRTADVSSNLLPMLGVELAAGRYFTDGEDNVNSDSIIVSYGTWQRRLGGRKDVVGQRVAMGRASSGDQSYRTVVGVLAPGFRFEGQDPEILLPVGIAAAASRRYSSGGFRVIARLAPGITAEQAEAEAAGLVAGTRTAEPLSARIVLLQDEHLGASRRPLWLLFGGAGVLLLIACANVAGILLGEARARRHEVAVRTALGSGRARLVRQVLVEHAMLAIVGTALGVAVTYWLVGIVVATAPEGLPRIDAVAVDVRAAVFAAAAGLVTLLLFGVAPAVSLARTPVASTLAEGGREGLVSRIVGQRAIVVAQLALALVLLSGAGLFAETMRRLTSEPLGFDPRGLVAVATSFTGHRYGDPATLSRARMSNVNFSIYMNRRGTEANNSQVDAVLPRLSAVPGVTGVAGTSAVPFVQLPPRVLIELDGRPEAEHDVLRQIVTVDYFETIGIRRLSGRSFGIDDRYGRHAAVVSREFEARFFPEGAVGRRFVYRWGTAPGLQSDYEIIGVVENVKRQEFSDDDRPAFYGFDRQSGGVNHFLLRASGDPRSVLPAVREAIREVDPQLVVTATHLMEERVARSVAEERFRAVLSSAFGVTALVLAAIGLYGVIARRTADRRREFGVRVALGARPADVGGLVLRDAALLVAGGLLIGLPAAYATAQVTHSLLYGITPSSPWFFAGVAAVLAAVAAAASFLPARRASLADPVTALRS